MARRSDHSREELYRLAIEAAREIVERGGFRALTARNVADAIGYSAGTLYNVFENLDDMVMHVNASTLDGLYDAIAKVRPTGHVQADIDKMLRKYLEYIAKHPGLWRMLFTYSLSDGYAIPDWYSLKIGRSLGLVEDALAPLFDAGQDDARATAARTLWAGLHGITALSTDGKLGLVTRVTVRDMTRTLARNFIAGIECGMRDAKVGVPER